MSKKPIYNTTQLHIEKTFERSVFHRDFFAHYFRWSKVMKDLKIGEDILDLGCGDGQLAMMLYANKLSPKRYVGVDFKQSSLDNASARINHKEWATFKQADLCDPNFDLGTSFDKIISFEVVEHIGHKNIDVFLDNIDKHAHEDTVIYISTPNYDPKVGAANNHLLGPDKEVGEWDHFELQAKLEEYFEIVDKIGTFASQKDYKKTLEPWQQKAFEEFSRYYDVNIISIMMAPLIDASQARNTLWILKVKE